MMDQIAAVRAFINVVEHGSFTAAADKLGVSKGLISKRIAALEACMGKQLLIRSTRRVSVTAAGSAFLERARHSVEAWDAMMRTVAEGDQVEATGLLRIASPMGFGETVLMDLVAEFLAGHPKLRIELMLEDCGIDFLFDRVDLMLRIGGSREAALISVPLCELSVVLCATPDYLARAGIPDTLDDLANHACIVNSELDATEKWWLGQRSGAPGVNVDPRVRVNNDVAARALVRAGLGVGLLVRQPINIDLQQGRLIEVLEGHGPSRGLVHAVFPSDGLLSHQTRLFLNFLKERLQSA